MTLTVGATWWGRIFAASDRLLTTEQPSSNVRTEFDPYSNKTVVICAQDCWLVIGYSGLAFLDGVPTDQFIAQVLSGHSDLTGVMSSMWNCDPNLHYRAIRDRIEHAISDAYTRLPRECRTTSLTIIANGYQPRRSRSVRARARGTHHIQPVGFHINVTQNGSSSMELLAPILKDPNNFRRNWDGVYDCATGTVLKALRQRSRERLHEYTKGPSNPPPIEGFRDILMDEVQVAAELFPDKVGSDVMGVIVDPVREHSVKCHFRIGNDEKHRALIERARQSVPGIENMPAEIRGLPTPFVLGPNGSLFGPSIESDNGGWDISTLGRPSRSFSFTVSGLPERVRARGEPNGVFVTSQPRRDQYGRYRDYRSNA